jgi:hypothetical protein
VKRQRHLTAVFEGVIDDVKVAVAPERGMTRWRAVEVVARYVALHDLGAG